VPTPYGLATGSGYGGVGMAGAGAQVSRRSSTADDSKHGGKGDPILSLARWFKSRSPKERLALLALAGVAVSSLVIARRGGLESAKPGRKTDDGERRRRRQR